MALQRHAAVSDLISSSVLELVREIAAEAATQVDTDSCLRLLRAGLIRLGFSRCGLFVIDLENPAIFRGTWGRIGMAARPTSTTWSTPRRQAT